MASFAVSIRSEEEHLSIQPQVSSTNEDVHITTSVSFPDQKSKNTVFKLNERANPVFAMQNGETGYGKSIRVEYLIGYIYRKGTTVPVQNCTGIRYNRTLSPGGTISMQYDFKPEVGLGVFDFVLQAFYLNEHGETKMKTAAATAVQFVSDGKWSEVCRYLLFALIFAGGIFGIRWLNVSEKIDGEIKAETPRAKAPKKEWEGIPKEHLQYVKSRQGNKR